MDEITAAGGSDARLALDVFGHRIAGAVAACAVAAGGLDALVFTGGIGEGSPSTRADVCGRLAFLGVELDERANERAVPDAVISAETSRVAVHAVQTREDVVAARAARDVLGL